MKTSPTQRTLKELRKRGVPCAVTEHWNSFAKIRQDLFGIFDILYLENSIVGVQCTSATNHTARALKVRQSPILGAWHSAGGRIEVWSWRKVAKTGKWVSRIEKIT